MSRWRSVYSNTRSGEICEICESSNALSRGLFWAIVNSMFYDACQGVENDDLQTVVECGARTYVIRMLTSVDGARIWTDVYVDGVAIRRMVIAD